MSSNGKNYGNDHSSSWNVKVHYFSVVDCLALFQNGSLYPVAIVQHIIDTIRHIGASRRGVPKTYENWKLIAEWRIPLELQKFWENIVNREGVENRTDYKSQLVNNSDEHPHLTKLGK